MRKPILIVVLALVAISVLAAVVLMPNSGDQKQTQAVDSENSMGNQRNMGNNSDQTTSPSTSQGNTVDIANFEFEPSKITIKKGTTVTWTNKDTAKHDITPNEPSEAFKASNLLSKGDTYSYTFNTVGTYTYFCSPHPYMKGTVVVTE